MAYFTRQAARNGAKPERIEPVTPRARVTKKKQQPQMRKSHPAGKQILTPKKKQLEAKLAKAEAKAKTPKSAKKA